jgi:hypothetical protein
MTFFRYARNKIVRFTNLDMFLTDVYKVLDITAGYRSFWKNKDCKGVIFIDVRREVKPDIVADNEHLPFRDSVFEFVFYDPPYVIRRHPSYFHTDFGKRYWAFPSFGKLAKNIVNVNREVYRVLKERGKLLVKYTPLKNNLALHSVLSLLDNFKEIRREVKDSKSYRGNKVYYILLEKK